MRIKKKILTRKKITPLKVLKKSWRMFTLSTPIPQPNTNNAKAAKEKVATIAWIIAKEIVNSEIRFSRIAACLQHQSAVRPKALKPYLFFPI